LAVEQSRDRRQFTLAATELDRLESAWFAQLHGSLWHFFLTASDGNKAIALSGVLRGPSGIDGLEHSHTTRSGIRSAWKKWQADSTLIRYDFELGLSLIDHVIEQARDPTGQPSDWAHFLHVVPKERVAAARGRNWLDELPTDTTPGALGRVDAVTSELHRRILLLDDEARTTLMERMIEVDKSKLEIIGLSREQRIREALLDTLEGLFVDEHTRADWVGRLNLTALHAKQSDDEPGLALFRASALALEAKTGVREIPLLARLVEPFTSYGRGGPMPDLRTTGPATASTPLVLPPGIGHKHKA
jgi:hypothetical protein